MMKWKRRKRRKKIDFLVVAISVKNSAFVYE